MKDHSEENSMVCGLDFEEHYTDPYDIHELSEDESRQQEIDALDDTLIGIGALYKPGFLTRLQAE